MKIIISRKGLDSTTKYGGIPSPIIINKDGSYTSVPIPIMSNREKSDIKYSLLEKDSHNFGEILTGLKPAIAEEYCHLDPDLNKSGLKDRSENWAPAFGQDWAAQSVLSNQGVKSGDIFLFMGYYRFAEQIGKAYRYIHKPEYPSHMHYIFGYMQIKGSFLVIENKIPDYLKYHPHYKFHQFYSPQSQANNTIYEAEDYLKTTAGVTKIPGFGYFKFNQQLILTRKGFSRSNWELPDFFHPDYGTEMGYDKKERWEKNGEFVNLKSVPKGQEFVVSNSSKVVNWALDLIYKFT